MARVTGPLLSLNGSGQIAKTQVYASWKGRPYVRRYVIPSNPQSSEQTLTRQTFAWLQNVWRYMPSGALDAWEAYAASSRFTPTNGFIKQNLSALREQANLDLMIFSPSAGGGLPAAAISASGGALQITVTLTAPSLPTGWTIIAAHAVAIKEQDPQTGTAYPVFYATDTSSPYAPVITGLAAATAYRVGGWFSYQKTPTEIAYGISLDATATTS